MEQALTLSDEAYEQATIYELGKPVSEYPSQTDTEKRNVSHQACFLSRLDSHNRNLRWPCCAYLFSQPADTLLSRFVCSFYGAWLVYLCGSIANGIYIQSNSPDSKKARSLHGRYSYTQR